MLDNSLMRTTIRDATNALQNSPNGELPKIFRIRIWKCFGPKRSEGGIALPPSPGVVGRYELERLCVEKAVPIWQKRFPAEKTPRVVMQCADQVLVDRSQIDYARRLYDESWLFSDNISASLFDSDPKKQYIAQVSYAACRLLGIAISDESYNESDVDDPTYLAFDPYHEDPALSASCAISQGSPFDTGSDNQLRRKFWLWYLRSAIPEAVKRLEGEP